MKERETLYKELELAERGGALLNEIRGLMGAIQKVEKRIVNEPFKNL